MKRLVPLLIFGGIAVFLFIGLGLNPREIPSPLIGKPVPEFELPRLEDPTKTIGTNDFTGRVSLVNVWATWCVSCRAEHKVLVELARTGKVDIVGLNYKDDRPAAQQWLRDLGNPYVANAFDENGRVAIDWGVYGAPETFVVDKQGIIRHKHIGPLTWNALNDTILPLVAQLNKEG